MQHGKSFLIKFHVKFKQFLPQVETLPPECDFFPSHGSDDFCSSETRFLVCSLDSFITTFVCEWLCEGLIFLSHNQGTGGLTGAVGVFLFSFLNTEAQKQKPVHESWSFHGPLSCVWFHQKPLHPNIKVPHPCCIAHAGSFLYQLSTISLNWSF